MNLVIIIGRMGQDPELKYIPNGKAVANFSLATSEAWTKDGAKQERTDWHRLVAWGKTAEIIGEFAKKGDLFSVVGKLKTRSYEKDDVKKYVTEIVVDRVELLGGKKVKTIEDEKEDDLPF